MSETGALTGKRVAMLVEDEFEDRGLVGSLEALCEAGASVMIVGPTAGTAYRGQRGHTAVSSSLPAGSAKITNFDALVIPGGHAPDTMRMRHAMLDLAP